MSIERDRQAVILTERIIGNTVECGRVIVINGQVEMGSVRSTKGIRRYDRKIRIAALICTGGIQDKTALTIAIIHQARKSGQVIGRQLKTGVHRSRAYRYCSRGT